LDDKPAEAADLWKEVAGDAVYLLDVLLVEDDDMLSTIMSVQLTLEGASVRRTANGLEAMRMIGEQAPALLILDVSLPGLNGYEIVEKLRQEPDLCTTPLIINTSQDLTIAEQRRLTLDRTMFITKTRATEELGQIVLKFLKTIACS
jgi:CheY-like chemotaxis protein